MRLKSKNKLDLIEFDQHTKDQTHLFTQAHNDHENTMFELNTSDDDNGDGDNDADDDDVVVEDVCEKGNVKAKRERDHKNEIFEYVVVQCSALRKAAAMTTTTALQTILTRQTTRETS